MNSNSFAEHRTRTASGLLLRPCQHQVAGHLFEEGKAGSLVDDEGHFYKPLQVGPRGNRELALYKLVQRETNTCTSDLVAELAALYPFPPQQLLQSPRRLYSSEGPSRSSSGGANGRPSKEGGLLRGNAKVTSREKIEAWPKSPGHPSASRHASLAAAPFLRTATSISSVASSIQSHAEQLRMDSWQADRDNHATSPGAATLPHGVTSSCRSDNDSTTAYPTFKPLASVPMTGRMTHPAADQRRKPNSDRKEARDNTLSGENSTSTTSLGGKEARDSSLAKATSGSIVSLAADGCKSSTTAAPESCSETDVAVDCTARSATAAFPPVRQPHSGSQEGIDVITDRPSSSLSKTTHVQPFVLSQSSPRIETAGVRFQSPEDGSIGRVLQTGAAAWAMSNGLERPGMSDGERSESSSTPLPRARMSSPICSEQQSQSPTVPQSSAASKADSQDSPSLLGTGASHPAPMAHSDAETSRDTLADRQQQQQQQQQQRQQQQQQEAQVPLSQEVRATVREEASAASQQLRSPSGLQRPEHWNAITPMMHADASAARPSLPAPPAGAVAGGCMGHHVSEQAAAALHNQSAAPLTATSAPAATGQQEHGVLGEVYQRQLDSNQVHPPASAEATPAATSIGAADSTFRGSTYVRPYHSDASFVSRNAPMLRAIPQFYGTVDTGEHVLLQLEDVAQQYKRPSIIDIKIGFKTWYPGGGHRYIQKCKAKDAATTQSKLGFKVCGMQVFRQLQDGFWRASKRWCKGMSEEAVTKALLCFANNEAGLTPKDIYGGPRGAIAQLAGLTAWFAQQTEFCFYSSSILIIYEGSATTADKAAVSIRLVDFAHTFPSGGQQDGNFLAGARALLGALSAVMALDCSDT